MHVKSFYWGKIDNHHPIHQRISHLRLLITIASGLLNLRPILATWVFSWIKVCKQNRGWREQEVLSTSLNPNKRYLLIFMETSYVSHNLYKITLQQTLWLSWYVVLESWAEWNNICDIVTTKDGYATYIIINSVSHSATWLNLLNCLGDGHIRLSAPMDTGEVRRTYKIIIFNPVRHRSLQLRNIANPHTLSKLKEMPCYRKDLATALRLRPSSIENHNMFNPGLGPYYSLALGWGSMILSNALIVIEWFVNCGLLWYLKTCISLHIDASSKHSSRGTSTIKSNKNTIDNPKSAQFTRRPQNRYSSAHRILEHHE